MNINILTVYDQCKYYGLYIFLEQNEKQALRCPKCYTYFYIENFKASLNFYPDNSNFKITIWSYFFTFGFKLIHFI